MSIEIVSHEEILWKNCLVRMNGRSGYVPEIGNLTQIIFHYIIIKSEFLLYKYTIIPLAVTFCIGE